MPGNELVQSLTRGLGILELAGKAENGVRVTDVADSLGIKFPTAHNLIRTLVAKNFLKKTDYNCYVPGSAFMELSENSSRKLKHSEMSRLMMKISEDIPDAVLIYAEESGGQIFSRIRIHPQNPGIVQKTDSQMKIYSTSSGLTFLAFANPELKDALVQESPFHEDGIQLWKSFSKLEKFLAGSARKSYVSPDFEGATRKAVSIPVYSGCGILRGALGATVDIDKNIKERVKTLALHLQEAIRTIKTN